MVTLEPCRAAGRAPPSACTDKAEAVPWHRHYPCSAHVVPIGAVLALLLTPCSYLANF